MAGRYHLEQIERVEAGRSAQRQIEAMWPAEELRPGPGGREGDDDCGEQARPDHAHGDKETRRTGRQTPESDRQRTDSGAEPDDWTGHGCRRGDHDGHHEQLRRDGPDERLRAGGRQVVHAETLVDCRCLLVEEHPGHDHGPWGSETRIRSRGGSVVLVDQSTEQVQPANIARVDRDRDRNPGFGQR